MESGPRTLYVAMPAKVMAYWLDLQELAGLRGDSVSTLLPHVTLQYCGKEVSDDLALRVKRVWEEALGAAQLSEEDIVLHPLNEFALYGKEHDTLVVKCKVSDKLTDAVGVARQRTCALGGIVESDFDFSPHVTLGTAHTLPKIDKWPETPRIVMDSVVLFGPSSEVREGIRLP